MRDCLVVLGALAAALSGFDAAFSNPRMRCEPQTARVGQTIVLHMPLPHGGQLGVWAPSKTFFFIAFTPEEGVRPPIPTSRFKRLRTLQLDTASARGLEAISRDAVPERIFRVPGQYRFIVSQNLETDDEAGVNLVCDVRLVE